ncbi:MAG: FAD-dependent oxidoreductase [Planctomycetia bacterium]|nr:MAG: FAD-dependent oxidoreductase [Planctomycetia bacterium]TVL97054.1 MAG: CoA-disulfide reductase [Candidatus Brocadia sp. BL1]HQU32296.1 FAD-dependent oxidoreductase [Candidatus Brocadia sapporoensis]
MNRDSRRILIIGGVAAGATCAARLRRLCERCTIVIFDRGPYVSFANCGLPYHVGNIIVSEEKLLVATPQLFKDRFNIEVHTETEVVRVDRDKKEIEVRDIRTNETRRESYDGLVLSTGANAVRPQIPGINLPGIFVLRTIPDSRKIRSAVGNASLAAIVGGGFIGLEMAENLTRRGLSVTIIQRSDQILSSLDPEMAFFVEKHLQANGVTLRLGTGVESFHLDGRLSVKTTSGDTIDTDMVILAMGVQPESSLARNAGLSLGDHGGIRVDDRMQTSDPYIWAVGDVAEVKDVVAGGWHLASLAGPANRQGRIAAAAILDKIIAKTRNETRAVRFRGVQGTAVCSAFGLTVAITGASEKTLKRSGIKNYEKIYLHPGSHASYFPDAKPIHIKLLFDTDTGRVLGAQAIGESGVARRIDIISMVIQMGGTVYDLEESELCYAPQFGAAKDPVNLAGMIAANHLRGDLPLAKWEELKDTQAQIVDVRSKAEYERGHIPGAKNIPLEGLRDRIGDLSKGKEIWLVCGVGQRAYYATRILLQNGFSVKDLSGGMQTYNTLKPKLNLKTS